MGDVTGEIKTGEVGWRWGWVGGRRGGRSQEIQDWQDWGRSQGIRDWRDGGRSQGNWDWRGGLCLGAWGGGGGLGGRGT